MGIHGLNKILRKYCNDLFHNIHLSEFRYQKVAIDTSLYMYKYKCILGEDWLNGFINLICSLRKNEVHPIFIYDSKAPPEKIKEQEDRRQQRQKIKDKLTQLENDWNDYVLTGNKSDVLIECCKEDNKKAPRLLSDVVVFKEEIILSKIDKLKLQTISITKEDFQLTKELFDILLIPYHQATTEAEATATYLCREGIVGAVLSEDTDVLAYGSPIFLTGINTHSETCTCLKMSEILERLDISHDQFRDMCIMCGTDYNKNIPRIGPQKSYTLIKTFQSIDGVNDNTILDVSILNHHRVRELFTFPNNYFSKTILYCGIPQYNKLQEFLFKNNLKIRPEYVERCFKPKPLTFVD